MTTGSSRLALAIVLAAGVAALAVGPLRAERRAPGVAGKWSLSMEGDHQGMTFGFVLKEDGKKVTGTLSSPHGDLPLEGEFADGTLTFVATLDEGGNTLRLTFTAKLNDDGTLAGTMSGLQDEVKWTAVRVKDGAPAQP